VFVKFCVVNVYKEKNKKKGKENASRLQEPIGEPKNIEAK